MKKTNPSSNPAKTKNPTPSTPASAPLVDQHSLAAAYARLLPEAELLPAERVVACRQDVNLVFANVQAGLAEVLPQLGRLKVELPLLPVDRFGRIADLAGALLYATAQVAASASTLRRELLAEKLARLHALREPMLLLAEALALMGILPKRRVEQIRSGSGPFDAAQDAVALVDLYSEFATVLHNKHPFTAEYFAEAAELGHTVLRAVTPVGARTPPSPELVQATVARDRLYSLLLEWHTDLRRAGFYLFAEEVDTKVPILGARKGRSRAAAPPAESLPETPAPKPALN